MSLCFLCLFVSAGSLFSMDGDKAEVGYILTSESNQFSVKRLAKSTAMYFLYLSYKEMTVHTELRKNNKPTSAD